MAETIINSNQLRASGDTSTQTLIGANQIRQSGDSSSQTLLNKNQIAQSQGTLNAEMIGTPTISDDWILSNTDESNYLKFHPENPVGKKALFTSKFRIADRNTKAWIFMCSPDAKGAKVAYGDDGAGLPGGLSCLITDSSGSSWGNTQASGQYQMSYVYTVDNQWMWIRFEFGIEYVKFYTSIDGETWTEQKNRNDITPLSNGANFQNLTYEQIGGKNETLEIDLKETKYYIDDVLSWEAVSF